MTDKESPSAAETGKQSPPTQSLSSHSEKKTTESQITTEFDPTAEMSGSSSLSFQPVTRVDGQQPDMPRHAVPPAASPESRYLVDRLYAEGGIGQVWLARDRQLHRHVAIKALRPELIGRDLVRNRFFQEAQITSQLEHPGIVPVYELAVDPESGSPFYCMRFVRGRTLNQAAIDYHQQRQAGEEASISIIPLLDAFVTICNTIAYAHSRGVIHRDLKGENILLGDYGEVFILDWGVAKVLGMPEEMENNPPQTQDLKVEAIRTVHGSIVGTPAYMAPEQAEGRSDLIDSRTDIYGLGAVLYEILTGQPPFAGTTTVEILEKVMRSDPIPPRRLWPGVPQTVEAACLRALSKDPGKRHASAAELGLEIQTWQEVQRRRVEEDLRRSRERFELAVRGSQDGLWDWDIERNEVFFSPRWKSILGYEDHEIANCLDEWTQRLHPEERERVLAANYAHINGTTSHYEYEYRLRHKDGTYRWILARGAALRDSGGKAYRMAGSHVDITAWKQMENSLKEAEQRYHAVFQLAPCGILVIDAEGNIRECNTAARDMLGIAADQQVNRSLIEICKPAVREDGTAIGEREIRGLIPTGTEQPYRRLIMVFSGEGGGSNRISFESRPFGAADETNHLAAVIFLQRVSN